MMYTALQGGSKPRRVQTRRLGGAAEHQEQGAPEQARDICGSGKARRCAWSHPRSPQCGHAVRNAQNRGALVDLDLRPAQVVPMRKRG
jgi:hypothetical protein